MANYVVLDLEMCRVPKAIRTDFAYSHELIEIGAVVLNESFTLTQEFQSYVAPQYGEIDENITNLTHITADHLKDAPTFAEIIQKFNDWLPEDSIIVCWSESDERQLRKEAEVKQLRFARLQEAFSNWIDCQELFTKRIDGYKRYNLQEALNIAGIDYDENIHDALIDARNTALLFAKLQEKNWTPASGYVSADDDSYMYTPLGDVFEDLLKKFKDK